MQVDGTSCLRGKGSMSIGVESNIYHRITRAPESYPAFRSGLRRGDILADPSMEPDVDGYGMVDYMRRGKRHHLRSKTQWICLW